MILLVKKISIYVLNQTNDLLIKPSYLFFKYQSNIYRFAICVVLCIQNKKNKLNNTHYYCTTYDGRINSSHKIQMYKTKKSFLCQPKSAELAIGRSAICVGVSYEKRRLIVPGLFFNTFSLNKADN